nr:glutamyl aminopeptidase-like [Rhipicephalus microplus]
MSVALLAAVSLISATVMALVQLLQLEEYKPGAEGGTNETTDVSDWTLVAAASPWRPVHYDLLLRPSIKNNTYEGYVNAVFEIQHNARQASGSSINSSTLYPYTSKCNIRYNLTVQFQGRLRKDYGLVLKRVGDQVILFMFPRKLDAFVTFPCFKDPGWKTTFDVRLLVDENLHASSTASIEYTTKESNGSTVYVFHRTEPMSAYLLSAIFTNFSVDKSGRMNLWSPTSFSPYRPLVLKTIEKVVSLLEDQIETWRSSLQVIDLVVAPDMLEMDCFRCRLRRPPADTLKDAWIAESLAYMFRRRVLQEMGFGHTEDRMRLLSYRDAMDCDDNGTDSGALRTTLIFSMLADLCPMTIRSGIRRYMKENKYGVADDVVLWRTLDLSGLLSRNMDSWFDHGGYPVVSVLRVNDHRGPGLVLKQGWPCFEDTNCNYTLVWPVPFVLNVQGGIHVPEEGAFWFRGTIQRYNLARDISSSWFLVNVATVSYFRVQYDADNVALLTRQLLQNHTVLNVNSRAKFLDDMVALTVRRMVSIHALVGLLTYLQKEESCAVWQLYTRSARKALEEFSGRTEYRHFYQRNQELCMLVQLEPTSRPCLLAMRWKICCFFGMCTLPASMA